MKKVFFLMLASLFVFTACKKEFTITVKSNNEAWGSVTGDGTYAKGLTISIGAIAKSGYKFVKWDDGNTENPRTIMVESDATYTAIFEKAASGGGDEPGGGGDDPVQGEFSVSDDMIKVLFSPGNLQWSATNGGNTATTHTVAGGSTAAGTWRFAPNQWDTIGANNKNISSTYSGWIDLFGWGTSGYHNSSDQYNTNYYPYSNSSSTVNTTYNYYGYGPSTNMANPDISGTNYDWGVYNAIYNPKTNKTDAPGTWRTLTNNEWVYLMNTRSTTSGIRYAKATVNGVKGLILVPDSWSTSTYNLNSTNTQDAAYTTNVITSTQWTSLENAGCVFLPAAGSRNGTSGGNVGSFGCYWSANKFGIELANTWCFDSEYVTYDASYRYLGLSVRLVRSAE